MYLIKVRNFARENNLPPKALLLVDNCSAHGNKDAPLKSLDGNIQVLFLPPNTTAILQPMDQSPIKVVKLKYRNLLLSKIVGEKDKAIELLLKKHTIADAIMMLKYAWDETQESVLKNAWNILWRYASIIAEPIDFENTEGEDFEAEVLVPLRTLNQKCVNPLLEEAAAFLNEISPNSNLTVTDVEEWNDDVVPIEQSSITSINVSNDSDVEIAEETDGEVDDDSNRPATKIKHSIAAKYIKELLEYCKQNEETASSFVPDLLNMQAVVAKKMLEKPSTQTSLKDYFSKSQ